MKSTIGRILVIALTVLAVLIMVYTIVSVLTFNRSDRKLFGYNIYIAMSDSMSATDFSAGDLVLVKQCDPDTLQEGDIISFYSTNQDNYGEVVTHKIRERTTDAFGNPAFVTYGTTTNTNDEELVTYDCIIGKYEKSIPKLGSFFNFMKTVPGYIICIFVPFFILILLRILETFRIFKQYKAEQMEEIKKEKQALREQADENRQLLAELLALKSEMQLARQGSEGRAIPSGDSPSSEAPAPSGDDELEDQTSSQEAVAPEDGFPAQEAFAAEESSSSQEAFAAEESSSSQEASPAEERSSSQSDQPSDDKF